MEKYNVLFILLDGFRGDRLNLCPNLMNILNKGYFFSNMITAAPYTLSAIHSIMTGLYPSKHGVDSYFNMFKFKKDFCKTFAQYMKDNGYYAESNMVGDSLVPTQGFDKAEVHNEYKDDLTNLHKTIISEASKKKFFLFLQYSNLHTQTIINVGKKYTDFSKEYFDDYDRNVRLYNEHLQKMDNYVEEIYNHLSQLGLLDNTIVIFFSDHGTSNGEKIGEKIYGSFTYDYTIKIFSSILVPGKTGKEIKYQTRTIDLMSTILELLDLKIDKSFEKIQGKSLMSFVDDKEKEDRVAFAETGGLNGPWPSHKEHNVFCVRFKNKKLIYDKTPKTWEFYDLDKDPAEKNNIYDGKNTEVIEFKKLLLGHIGDKGDLP